MTEARFVACLEVAHEQDNVSESHRGIVVGLRVVRVQLVQELVNVRTHSFLTHERVG